MLNKLWKIWIAAQEMGIETEDLFFHIGDTFSPYTEVSLKSLQAEEGQALEGQIAVNPFFKWNSIFSPLLEKQKGAYDELTIMLSDLVLHYIAEADAFSGMSKEEFYIHFIVGDMENGRYGCIKQFAILSGNEKKQMANQLLCLYRTNQPMLCLAEAISLLFPGAKLHLGEKGFVFLFMNQSRDERQQQKLEVILTLFLDLEHRAEIYWERFPGVIGVEETMGIEEFMIG